MAYERTLISDDALYDQWAEAPGGLSFEASNHKGLMSPAQMRGMRLFFTNELVPGTEKKGLRGNCSTCHQGPLFTTATFPFTEEEESGEFPEQEVIIERMLRGDGIHIAEDLMRFFVSGQGTVGGYTLDGRAGSWEMPNIYRATVGGDFTVNGSACIVESYLMNQDRTQPPPAPMEGVAPEPPGPSDFADYSTKDAVFRVTGCGGGPDGLEITIVDNGVGNDTATIRELVAIGLPGSAICPECYDIPPIYGATLASGAIDGDFTLEIPTLYDTAFYNIGVRPTAEDPGIGDEDPFGIPLSFTQQWIHQILYEDNKVGDIENLKSINFGRIHNPFNWYGDSVWFPAGFQGYTWMTHRLIANGNYPDEFCVLPFPPFNPAPPPFDVADQPTCEGAGFQWNIVPEFSLTPGIAEYFFLEKPGRGDDAVPLYEPVQRQDGFATIPMNVQNYQAIVDMPTAMDGAFKVPNLRNVSLTGPFFHNGGTLTLGQVVEFYNRGGDFAMENLGDTAPNIHPLNLDTGQIADIVAFLEAFTDERVRCEQGPFDHPEIIISRGHTGDTNNVVDDGTGRKAAEDFEEVIPASGAAGLAPANCLKGFLE